MAACHQQAFDIVVYDAETRIAPLSTVLEKARLNMPGCPIYALYGQLNAAQVSEAIRQGVTSFAVKSDLPGLIRQLSNPILPTDLEQPNANLQHILEGFLEESTDSIWVKNKHGKYLLINPAGAQFLSRPSQDILGKNDYELFPEATADKITRSDREVMANGITQTVEDLLITHDGISRTFLAVKGVWRDAQADVAGVIGTVRDITERKQTEENLRQSEERFRRLVEGVKDHAIYMLDPAGLIISWNIGAERLQGFQTPEIIGRHFSRFYAPDENPEATPEFILRQATENGCHEQECFQVRKDGSHYWANIIITPMYGEKEKLIGFSTVVRDMTEQRKAEEAQKNYATKLEQSNQDLEQFAMIASHDLQAPLRKVRLFSEMLEQHTNEEGKDIAKRLQGAAEKMQHFISDLLELSRINRKGRPFQPVNLTQVIQRVKEDLELIIQESNATITIEELGTVFGDMPQLEQLCLNIMGNGLKFKRPNTTPHLKIKGETLLNGFYQLTIQDNGIGFKEEYLEKIFRPFERLHGPAQFPGTGMGLAICRKIVDRHGGQITANSIEGEGSTFIIYLPISPPHTPNPQDSNTQSLSPA